MDIHRLANPSTHPPHTHTQPLFSNQLPFPMAIFLFITISYSLYDAYHSFSTFTNHSPRHPDSKLEGELYSSLCLIFRSNYPPKCRYFLCTVLNTFLPFNSHHCHQGLVYLFNLTNFWHRFSNQQNEDTILQSYLIHI